MPRSSFASVREKTAAARKAAGKERASNFDDITGVTDVLREVVAEVRQKQPSVPEVHIHTEAHRDSTPTELKIAWKHRGLLVRALPWVAGLGLGAAAHRALRAIGVLH